MEKIKINYDRTYSSKYNRDYYRGKSFHYAGRWKLGARYVNDEFNSDFIVYDEVMLICKKSHTATPGNEPKDIYELEDGLLGLNSEYWDVVMPALYGGSKYIVIGLEQEKGHSTIHGMSQNAITIELDALDEAIRNNVERIDSDIAQKWSSINQRADEISATVAENRRISEEEDRRLQANITINAEAIATEVSDRTTKEGEIIADYNSKFTQTAREIATEVSAREAAIEGVTADYNSKISQTATQIRSEVNAHVETLEGEINDTNSALTQTAGEIRAEVASTKTDLEGQIETAKAEIKVTTDAITSTVEANKQTADGQYTTLNSKIDQTAENITSTVESYKEELDGTIADNYSVLDQKADSISATVAANKIDADGKINTLQSSLTQTATEIRAEVEANKQETDGAIADLSSSLTLTAEEIRGEVSTHVETLEGEISDTNSSITQTAAQIRSDVTQQITNTETNITNAYTSAIDQKADSITSSVKETTDALGERVTTAETNITQNTQGIALTAEKLDTLETSVGERFATDAELLQSLQKQVDGAIETYYYDYEPTLQNFPASDWTTDEIKENHVGDLFYNKSTGYSYRFFNDNGTYKWSRILDSDITTALAKAAEAKTTADGKMTIFYDQPSTYRKGDLWIMEVAGAGDTGDKKDCIIKKSTEDRNNNYVSSDWVLVSDIANASKVKAAFNIMADMIDSQVAEYTSDNELVPGSLYSHILQSRDQISLKIGTAKSEAITNATGQVNGVKQNLLDTGIDITNKKIEMTADNIVLKNNSGTRSLSIANGSDGKPIIAASNLQLDGVLSIGDWNNGKMDLEAYTRSKANAAEANAEAAAKADLATKLGYDSYEAMVIAAQNGNTIINGGYLRTNLIDTDALYVKHLNGADGTFTGALNAATGSFSGEVTATKFTISNDATVSGLKVSQVNGAASSSALATTNSNVTVAKNRADSAYALAQQADTAASDAETNAKNDLAKRLGYASYDDMVEKAQAGKTIVDGAYIRTGLINAEAVVTNYLSANKITADQIDTTNLTISAGKVSGLGSLATRNNIGASDLDSTIISGGYIKTGLIDVDALYVKHLDGANGTFTGTVSAGTISGGSININNKFIVNSNGSVNASDFTVSGGYITGSLELGNNGQIFSSNTSGSMWRTNTVNISADSITSTTKSSASASISYTSKITGDRVEVRNQYGQRTYLNDGGVTYEYNNEMKHAIFGDLAYSIAVVSTLPSSPDAYTLYFVTS